MANLSQQRRQRMLDFLQKVREKNKDDDDALVAIGEIENEITEKKYGLVWEEHSEEVEERMVEEVPVFVEDKDKEITLTEDGYNFLLEGDNLHSLHLLEKTHKEKIDVIYIDPPYNTGNNDFVYDDCMIDENDTFRHSKWLSFMERRLRIAKNLLSKDGTIFISIDDNEQAPLKLLCDEIFGADNFESMISWRRRSNQPNDNSKMIAIVSEYVAVYTKDAFVKKALKSFGKMPVSAERLSNYTNPDNDPKGDWSSTPWCASRGQGGCRYTITTPTGKEYTETWLGTEETFNSLVADGRIIFPNNGNGKPRKKIYASERQKEGQAAINFWVGGDYGDNMRATAELKELFPNEYRIFDYAKPTTLIKTTLRIGTNRKDAVILDFFAGSGTTGQAVLELNKEDGGNRKFILCTNNENNICEGVTYPRLQTVITGVRQDGNKYSDGIPANLKYYKTDYIPKKSDNLSADLIKHIDEMIQLEYHVKIDKDKYISVLTDEDADELEKNWQNFPNIRAIYISRSVLLTGKQRELFETKDCFVIPDYYFREELRDAGEA